MVLKLFLATLVAGALLATESSLVCNRSALTASARRRHFDELGPALYGIVRSVREVTDGYEFQFPADPASYKLVAEWVGGERLCCPFFDIDLLLEREKGALWLRLTGRQGVKDFIKVDFDPWFKAASLR